MIAAGWRSPAAPRMRKDRMCSTLDQAQGEGGAQAVTDKDGRRRWEKAGGAIIGTQPGGKGLPLRRGQAWPDNLQPLRPKGAVQPRKPVRVGAAVGAVQHHNAKPRLVYRHDQPSRFLRCPLGRWCHRSSYGPRVRVASATQPYPGPPRWQSSGLLPQPRPAAASTGRTAPLPRHVPGHDLGLCR